MKRIGIILACVALGALAICACGCAQSTVSAQSSPSSSSPASSSSSASTSASSSAKDTGLQTIGEGDCTVEVLNETGYDVIGIRIKPTSQESYTAENSFDGFNFANGDTASLSFDEVSGATAYDVLLLTSNNSKIAVRGINLTGLSNIAFRFDEGVGFITYSDPQTGEGSDNRDEAMEAELRSDTLPSDLEDQMG